MEGRITMGHWKVRPGDGGNSWRWMPFEKTLRRRGLGMVGRHRGEDEGLGSQSSSGSGND